MKYSSVTLILLFIALFLFWVTMYGRDFIVNHLVFYPDTENVLAENRLPHGIEEFYLTTEDGVKIHSLYLPLTDSDKVLIYFHGNAGNIYHRISDLNRLRAFGINVVGVSYRGYGKSEGKPSEEGIYWDGQAVFNYVANEMGFSQNNIIIMGRSIGTAAAINTAQYRSIAGLILVTPLSSAKAQAEVMAMGMMVFLAGNAFDNLSKIENVKAPLLVVHGTNDQVIPYALGKQLFDRYRGDKRFIKIVGAGHNDIQYSHADIYWQSISDFIAGL